MKLPMMHFFVSHYCFLAFSTKYLNQHHVLEHLSSVLPIM